MQQLEIRFYDKHPEQLSLDITQQQPQLDIGYFIGTGHPLYFTDGAISNTNFTVNLDNIAVEVGEKPSLIKRFLLKQLGIKIA